MLKKYLAEILIQAKFYPPPNSEHGALNNCFLSLFSNDLDSSGL